MKKRVRPGGNGEGDDFGVRTKGLGQILERAKRLRFTVVVDETVVIVLQKIYRQNS